MGVGLLVILMFAFIAALLMNAEKISAETAGTVSGILVFLGAVVAACFSAIAAGNRKLLHGLAAATGLLLLLLLIGAGTRHTDFSSGTLFYIAPCALVGGVAGSLLSALKRNRRQR